jgi:hypothetical protein
MMVSIVKEVCFEQGSPCFYFIGLLKNNKKNKLMISKYQHTPFTNFNNKRTMFKNDGFHLQKKCVSYKALLVFILYIGLYKIKK